MRKKYELWYDGDEPESSSNSFVSILLDGMELYDTLDPNSDDYYLLQIRQNSILRRIFPKRFPVFIKHDAASPFLFRIRRIRGEGEKGLWIGLGEIHFYSKFTNTFSLPKEIEKAKNKHLTS